MSLRSSWLLSPNHPILSLTFIFVLWKLLILLIVAVSPGPGYDSSSRVLLESKDSLTSLSSYLPISYTNLVRRLTSNLVRWDAVYFTKAIERGHVYENEWAFSWSFSRSITPLAKYFPFHHQPLKNAVCAAVFISNSAHLLSVLVLYHAFLMTEPKSTKREIAFTASALHILSPAGIFLTAPYSESAFSLLSFSGVYLYMLSVRDIILTPKVRWLHAFSCLGAGLCWGLATAIRSNGILNGLVFLYDIVLLLKSTLIHGLSFQVVFRSGLVCVSGMLVFLGFVIPQWVGYQEFCNPQISKNLRRSWCSRTIPSIYTWIQGYYWDVGFLRYWKFPNLPLFLLATPILVLLVHTGLQVLSHQFHLQRLPKRDKNGLQNPQELGEQSQIETQVAQNTLIQLTFPQIAIAILAFVNFHVQIINRLCSGYPIWYLVVARGIQSGDRPLVGTGYSRKVSQYIIRGIIIYAIIQAGLFASFLPPA